jgi:hypothetical protein
MNGVLENQNPGVLRRFSCEGALQKRNLSPLREMGSFGPSSGIKRWLSGGQNLQDGAAFTADDRFLCIIKATLSSFRVHRRVTETVEDEQWGRFFCSSCPVEPNSPLTLPAPPPTVTGYELHRWIWVGAIGVVHGGADYCRQMGTSSAIVAIRRGFS